MLTEAEAVERLDKMFKIAESRGKDADELRGFYQGDQPLTFASDQWRDAHQDRYKSFSDNWCGVVANSTAERLEVIGFKLPSSDSSKQSDSEKKLHDAWVKADGDMKSAQGFLESIVTKRSFSKVWGTADGDPILTWHKPDEAVVTYDAETGNKREFGAFFYDDEDQGLQFGTLYDDECVYRFKRTVHDYAMSGLILPRSITNVGGWEPIDEEPGVNHLGEVPIVEYDNRPLLGGIALSDIAGTMSMQNAINLLWAYLFNAADFASMPGRVVMGQDPPKIPILNQAGQKVGEQPIDPKKLTEGRMLWLTGSNAKIEQWDAAKLDVFTEVIEKAVGHIAAQTRTPPHYLVANKGLSNLSGDALKAAETGLVQKAQQASKSFVPRLRATHRLLALQLGDDKMADECLTGIPRWADMENRSDAQTSDAMVKDKTAGYPFEFLLEKRGHSPEEIDRIMKMKKREDEAALAAGLAAFSQMAPEGDGGAPGVEPGQERPGDRVAVEE